MNKKNLLLLSMVSLGLLVGCSTNQTATETTKAETAAQTQAQAAETVKETEKETEAVSVELPKFLTMGTAGTGGALYPVGIVFCDIITNELGIQATAQVTGGTMENVPLVNNGEVEFGLTKPELAYKGNLGVDPFESANENIRGVIAGISRGAFQAVVLEKSSILTIADLKGKKVVMGPAGGGAIESAPDVLGGYGLTLDDINAVYVSYDEGATMLKDGQVDAVFVQSAAPASAIQQIIASDSIRFLSITQEIIDQIIAEYPYYISVEIPKETYGTEESITTLGNITTLIANKDVSEEVVYQITKAIWENIDQVYAAHSSTADLNLEEAGEGFAIDIHPGAERYYREMGVLE